MNAAECEGRKTKGGGGDWGLRGQQVTGLKCETPLRREDGGGLGSLLGI